MIDILTISIFVCGCIGASAPEIVRLYKLRSKPLEGFSRRYYLISILFFLLGGFVSVILPATTLYGAFYMGVALPSIVTAIASKPPRYIHELSASVGSHSGLRMNITSWREYLGVLIE